MKPLPKLAIGQQYFGLLRKRNGLYIDKTESIYNLCDSVEQYYFLSRPRRFGKSLTLDTIHELFNGNKALFEGLWIADKWDWSLKHSVIRLSLDTIGDKAGLAAALNKALHKIAAKFKVKLIEDSPGQLFQELIQKVAEKSKNAVVILIDEYDRPIVDSIDPFDYRKAIEHRDILKEFFSILKDNSNLIRLLFITGVTKFARVSIFSSLNHLTDLTLNPRYAALCGYTQAELEHSFQPYLETMPPNTLDLLKYWYDGYSWDGKTFLYNPFSVLNFFATGIYEDYWFETGTPTLVVKFLSERFEYQLEEKEVSSSILNNFVLDRKETLDLTSLLLQTGYLTIKEIRQDTPWDDRTFILRHPNQEVKRAFNRFLLSEYTQTQVTILHHLEILRALAKNEIPRVIQKLNHLIQSIPDQNYIKNEEKFFQAIIHLIFTMIGTDVRYELHTPIGRADTVVITKDHIFIFEFKINESADDALQQIENKRYADALRHRNLPIIGIGVSFQTAQKGISDHRIKLL
jgi:hypothetical protein